MTEHETNVAGAASGPPASPMPLSAGAQLASAREAAGLTLDAVAQQLKLAPRQVRALEDGDFAKLPGRTFVRGFVRNYARLLHLDPDAVVAALPGTSTPALDSPALHPTAPTMGELPATERGKPGWTRWAIPLILIAVIAGAAIYEYLRQRGDGPGTPAAPREPAAGAPAPQRPASPPPPAEPVESAPNKSAPVTLANPLAAPEAAQASAAAAPPEKSADAAGMAPIVLAFRDSSWTEVKDRRGEVLLSKLSRAGQTQSLAGVPPIDLVIGNATEVSLTYRGAPIDLAPYTNKGIARLTLE
jgi:cytoskeleton protein RodZ